MFGQKLPSPMMPGPMDGPIVIRYGWKIYVKSESMKAYLLKHEGCPKNAAFLKDKYEKLEKMQYDHSLNGLKVYFAIKKKIISFNEKNKVSYYHDDLTTCLDIHKGKDKSSKQKIR